MLQRLRHGGKHPAGSTYQGTRKESTKWFKSLLHLFKKLHKFLIFALKFSRRSSFCSRSRLSSDFRSQILIIFRGLVPWFDTLISWVPGVMWPRIGGRLGSTTGHAWLLGLLLGRWRRSACSRCPLLQRWLREDVQEWVRWLGALGSETTTLCVLLDVGVFSIGVILVYPACRSCFLSQVHVGLYLSGHLPLGVGDQTLLCVRAGDIILQHVATKEGKV